MGQEPVHCSLPFNLKLLKFTKFKPRLIQKVRAGWVLPVSNLFIPSLPTHAPELAWHLDSQQGPSSSPSTLMSLYHPACKAARPVLHTPQTPGLALLPHLIISPPDPYPKILFLEGMDPTHISTLPYITQRGPWHRSKCSTNIP